MNGYVLLLASLLVIAVIAAILDPLFHQAIREDIARIRRFQRMMRIGR